MHRRRAGLSEKDLSRAYDSEWTRVSNYEQSLELAFLIARKMEKRRSGAIRSTRKPGNRPGRTFCFAKM